MSFPPEAWLGYGLNMTQVTPNDIQSATEAILTAYRVIPLADETKPVKIKDITWNVPIDVHVATDVATSSSAFQTWASGTELAKELKVNVALSAQYMAVSGDVSVGYSESSAFSSDRCYSLFSYNEEVALCGFQSWGKLIDKDALATAISALNLVPFDPNDASVVDSYRTLFAVLGSHIVVGSTYGGRFQMSIFVSNQDSSYSSEVTADIGVQYNGLCTSGKFDASIASSDQYKAFSREVQQSVSCKGGQLDLASKLEAGFRQDDIYNTFTSWIKTAATNPGVMSLQTATLWDVMSATFDPDILQHAHDVKKAFKWIMENPELHSTPGRMTINSDWGEFGLTSPNAYLVQDPKHPIDPSLLDNLVFSGTKVMWGKEHSHQFQRDVTIDFLIINDGSAVNFELSHGSDGSQSGEGRVEVDFGGKVYQNNGITDNNWNTQFYYGAGMGASARLPKWNP